MNKGRAVIELDLNDVLPNRFQPRIKFDEDAIIELSESIKEHGVIQPIIVRKMGDKYEIIAGERRYKASVMAGKTSIPALVTDYSDKVSAEIALIENVQREDLTAIEEAVSYRKILDMGYMTQDDLARKLDKTQSTIANKLRLLNLTTEVQEALLNKKISERHARSLLKIKDSRKQLDMLDKVLEQRLTVRNTDIEIKKMMTESESEPKIADSPIEKPKEEVKGDSIFNIPTEPIVEEIDKTNNENHDAGIFKIPNRQEIDPGFVDVNKIEQTAVDINTATQTEKPNIEDLVKITKAEPVVEQPVYVDPMAPTQIIPEKEVIPEKPLTTGKFFNFLSPNEEPQPEPEITEEEQKLDSLLGADSVGLNTEPVRSEFEDETTKVEEEKVKERPENIFEKFNNAKVDLNELPNVEKEAVAKATDVETIEIMDIMEDELMIPQIPEAFEEIQHPVDVENKKQDLKTIINQIRNLSAEFTKNGAIIDLEEVDFVEMYQITFKIQK